MATVTTETRYTPEDLLAMPDGDLYELVDGRLVERNMSALAGLVGARIIRLLGDHLESTPLGDLFQADTSYQCYADDPDKVRKPDVSFIKTGRLPQEQLLRGHVRIAPDLAVEVLSPNDLAYQVDEKVEEYLRAGVQLVWVVNPETRTVAIFRQDGSTTRLRESDELSGESVVAGFRCPVRDLFPPVTRSASPREAGRAS